MTVANRDNILVRNGVEADRTASMYTPSIGEPLWTTDDRQFWIGDGVTVGGVLIGPSGATSGGGSPHDLGGASHNDNGSTLAAVSNKISDGTLIDTADSRLSDKRTPVDDATVASTLRVGNSLPASADGTLHVHTSSVGAMTPSSEADDLIIEDNNDAGLTIFSNGSKKGNIYFGRTSSGENQGRIVYDHNGNDSLSLFVNDNHQILITGAGNAMMLGAAGIGTYKTPRAMLDIVPVAGTTKSPNTNANTLVLESNTSHGLSILTDADSLGNIYFGNESDDDAGRIRYDHSLDAMTLWTNGTTAITIDSSQNIAIVGDLTINNGDDVSRILDRDTTTTTVENTETGTVIYTFSVPANIMGTDRMLRMTLFAVIINNSGSDEEVTITVRFGGTIFLQDTFTLTTSTINMPFQLQVEVANFGSASIQRWMGHLTVGDKINATVGDGAWRDATMVIDGLIRNSSTVDTTSAQTFDVLFTWDSASASAIFDAEYTVLELV